LTERISPGVTTRPPKHLAARGAQPRLIVVRTLNRGCRMSRTRMPRSVGPPASKPHTVGLAILSRHYREALALALKSSDLIVTDLGDDSVERILERLLHLRPDVALVDLPSSE